jgi:hypothetical protein
MTIWICCFGSLRCAELGQRRRKSAGPSGHMEWLCELAVAEAIANWDGTTPRIKSREDVSRQQADDAVVRNLVPLNAF